MFDEQLAQIESSEADCKAWREFFEKSHDILLSIDAAPCHQFYGFDSLAIKADCSEKEITKAVEAIVNVKDFSPEFLRDNLFSPEHWCEVSLSQILFTQSKAKVRFGFKKPIVMYPGSFRLKHVKRFGKRWGRLYVLDPRIRNARREGGQEVASSRNFDEDATRPIMWNTLMADVQSHAESALFSISEDCLMDSIIRAQVAELAY